MQKTKILMKEIKQMEGCTMFWFGRINIKKEISFCTPKEIYRFNAIPIKQPISTEIEQKIHNLYGNTKDPK